MLELVTILASYGAVIIWQMLRDISERLYKLTDIKPFNCNICMSFWIGLILSSFIYDFDKSLIIAFASSGVTHILKIVLEVNGVRKA